MKAFEGNNCKSIGTYYVFYTALSEIENIKCNAVLLLSYFLYLTGNHSCKKGWFCCSSNTAWNRLGLTDSQFKTAKEQLKRYGLIDTLSLGTGKCDSIRMNFDSLVNLTPALRVNTISIRQAIDCNDHSVSYNVIQHILSKSAPVVRYYPRLVTKKHLSITAAFLLNQIHYFSSKYDYVKFPTRTFSKLIGCGRTKVESARDTLIVEKLIKSLRKGPGNYFVYELTDEAIKLFAIAKQPNLSTQKHLYRTPKTKKGYSSPRKSEAKTSTPQAKSDIKPSDKQHSIYSSRNKKNSEIPIQQRKQNNLSTSIYTPLDALALITDDQWTSLDGGDLTAGELKGFAFHLQVIGEFIPNDRKTIEDWLSDYQSSKRRNCSLTSKTDSKN